MFKWLKEDKALYTWMPSMLWGMLITLFSLTPNRYLPELTLGTFDVIAHFFSYFILSALIFRGFYRHADISFLRNGVYTLIICFLYGILIELLQEFVPGREASLIDVIANSYGAITGVVAGRLMLWRK